jgi:hypothetical protein
MSSHEERPVGSGIRFYAPAGLQKATFLEPPERYAEARSAIPMFGLDGMPCGMTPEGKRAVVLLKRKRGNMSDGPFRGEPWFTGGKWDMVTPFEEFVREKTIAELYGAAIPESQLRKHVLKVEGPIGHQLFGTGWEASDGPHGKQGVSIQYCFQVHLPMLVTETAFSLDQNHEKLLIVKEGEPLPKLHPYIRDVIEMSGWLNGAATTSS